MTVYSAGMKTGFTEDGIWMDFRENTWIFVITDSEWMPEELRRAKNADINLTFVQKGIVDAFLVEIYDCMETSDVPFCMKDADESFVKALKKSGEFKAEVVTADGKGQVIGVREGKITRANSDLLREKLLARMNETYTSEDFDKAYAKLAERYEPFELEPFAVFAQKVK